MGAEAHCLRATAAKAAPYYATVQACRPGGRWREALLVLGAMRADGDADRHHASDVP